VNFLPALLIHKGVWPAVDIFFFFGVETGIGLKGGPLAGMEVGLKLLGIHGFKL
jgi:hypothetical protein